jgi:hypothetical protein
MTSPRDRFLENDGVRFVVSNGYWVLFRMKQVPASTAKPHGLDYSLTLHDANGKRLVGFDNAYHRVKGQRQGKPQDHHHRRKTVKRYHYHDEETLLVDFWTEVDIVLKEEGATP